KSREVSNEGATWLYDVVDFRQASVTGLNWGDCGSFCGLRGGEDSLTVSMVRPPGGRIDFDFTLVIHPDHLASLSAFSDAAWEVSFFGWEKMGDVKSDEVWKKVTARPPLERRPCDRIDFLWGNPDVPAGRPGDFVPSDKVPHRYYAL